MAILNALGTEEFVSAVGGIFEHSPWIAAAVAPLRPFAGREELLQAMVAVVEAASSDDQRTLIRAHPDLAGRLAQQGKLTAESTREQAAAGITAADSGTVARIGALNAAYRERFGFPFIICARLNNVDTIVAAMETRLGNDPRTEEETALAEIAKIARLRLADLVED